MKGENNHNFKNACPERQCKTCGKLFKPKNKSVKYCSRQCVKHPDLKARGTGYERKAKKELEAQGYIVVRSAGSLGVFDLIAINKTEVLLIQIKATLNVTNRIEKLYAEEIQILQKLENIPLLAKVQLWCWRSRKGWEIWKKEQANGKLDLEIKLVQAEGSE